MRPFWLISLEFPDCWFSAFNRFGDRRRRSFYLSALDTRSAVPLLLLLTAGIAILLACANLFFRDVKYLVEVLLTYGIFFTPVFYSASALGKWGSLLLLNPVRSILKKPA